MSTGRQCQRSLVQIQPDLHNESFAVEELDQTREMTEERTRPERWRRRWPDQRDDTEANRTRPRVEQTREMTEERSRPERWRRRGPDQGWSRPERWEEQQTGWRSMWLETGTADRMEEHVAGDWNSRPDGMATKARRRVMTAPKERRRGDHDRGPPPASRTMTSSGYESCFF